MSEVRMKDVAPPRREDRPPGLPPRRAHLLDGGVLPYTPTYAAPPPLPPRPSMSPSALWLLRFLRDCTGQWVTMYELRALLRADTRGFGEPVVYMALSVIRGQGIKIEESARWVEYPPVGCPSPVPAVHDEDLTDVAATPKTLRPGGRLSRENVWRLP